jgi:hypothetical protein
VAYLSLLRSTFFFMQISDRTWCRVWPVRADTRPFASACAWLLCCSGLLLALPFTARAGGEVQAWGRYLHHLGNGQFSTNQLTAPAGLSQIIAVASGLQHVTVLGADGRARSFGEWEWGLTNVPAGLDQVMAIAAGDYHSLALTRNRQVRAWGASFNNQGMVPVSASNVVAIAAGGFHSLALRADGQVIAWGDNRYGQCNPPANLTNAIALAAGTWHSLALLDNGRVVAWGANSAGQLNVPASLTNAVAIAARAGYSLALRANGTVTGWGLNDGGQLLIPSSVQDAVAISAGDRHALAVLRSGTVVGWGLNNFGQAVVPAGNGNVATVSAGSLHSALALRGVPPQPAAEQTPLTIRPDRRVLLAAGVPGSQPMTYQWRRDGGVVPGATGPMLLLARAQATDAGLYSVVASNAAGQTTSLVARLVVAVPDLAGARFLFRDDTTVGNWKGTYGSQAGVIFGHATNAPLGNLTLVAGVDYPFSTNTPDVRALERVDSSLPTNRFSGCVFGADYVELRCPFPFRETNQLALYLMEPGGGRAQSVEIFDDANGDRLDRRDLGAISNGTYLAWEVSGPLRVRVSRLAGYNALLSGVFLGRAVGAAPTVRAEPVSQTVAPGTRTFLGVGASGEPPLTFQWRRNGLPVANSSSLSGATAPVLTLQAVSAAAAGHYTVVISNAIGTVTSAVAVVSMPGAGQPPAILSPPQSVTAAVGALVGFSVSASGTAPLAYQWRRNGAALGGATQSSLTLAAAQAGQAGGYSVVVTNPFGAVTSTVASLTLTNPGVAPTITTQPRSLTNVIGSSVSFTVTASGTAPLAYQWRRNGAALGGATQSSLTLAAVQAGQAGGYSVVVTNPFGAVTSTVASLTLTNPGVAPTITTQPRSLTNVIGSSVSFSVSASGTAPLAYQWRRNGAALGGATQSSLTLAAVQAGQAGGYSVVATNPFGAVTSTVASLTLTNPGVAPTITTQPRSLTNVIGSSVSFSVTASGTAPLAYQWRRNGAALGGATQSSLTLAAVQAGQAGGYSVVVTNPFGAVTSTVASLTLTNPPAPPIILADPVGGTNYWGDDVTFTVTANGTPPLSYQWWFSGAGLIGATGTSLTLTTVQPSQSGPYLVVVTNLYGAVTSRVATLAVNPFRPVGEDTDLLPLNRVPQPMDDLLTLPALSAATITSAQLLANDKDPDGDALVLSALSAVSQRGATLTLSGSNIRYHPPSATWLWDRFDYWVRDTNGALARARVTLQFGPGNGARLTPMRVPDSSHFQMQVAGVPGRAYVIQAAPSPHGPWSNLTTNQTPATGQFEWIEATPPPITRRFYRVAQW